MILVGLTVVSLAACLGIAGYVYLPILVTKRLPVVQIQQLGFLDFTGRVSRIGLRQTAAGPIVFGPPDRPTLAIHSMELDYTLGELRRKKVRSLRIRDVTVNGSLAPEGFGITLPGMPAGPRADAEPAGTLPTPGAPPLGGLTVDKIEVRSGMINLTWRTATYKIPFEADLEPDGKGMTHLKARLHVFPRDHQFTLTARVDLQNRRADVSLDGARIDLDRFADLIDLIPGLEATGTMTVQAGARVRMNPWTLSDANVDLSWHSGRLAYASLVLEPLAGESPTVLSAVSGDLDTWRLRGGGLQLQKPLPVALNMLTATAHLGGDPRSVEGEAELSIRSFAVEHPIALASKGSVLMPLRFVINQNAVGDWTALTDQTEKHSDTPSDGLDLTAGGIRILAAPPHFNLAVQGDGEGATANWQLDLDTIQAARGDTVVRLASTHANGRLQFSHARHGPTLVGEARIQVTSPTFAGHGLEGELDALTLSARFQQEAGDPQVLDARLHVSNGRFRHPASGLHVAGGRLDLPFRSDPEEKGGKGTFSVGSLVYNNRSLGKVQGGITQKKDAYDLSATHASDLFPGMTAVFSGMVYTDALRMAESDFTFQIPPYQLPAGNDLGRVFPAIKGIILAGIVSARGEGSLSSKGVRGSLDLGISGGALTMAEKKISVAGIDTTLNFPELPRIRSSPAQQIRFARAAMGSIVVDAGSLDVQVESGNTLFIEKGRLDWCGGKVDAQALRITTGKPDYTVSLYCQRLGLSQILEQLGAVNARGSGTVNGRIPIVYNNGKIRFDDGFLFSTPGETGQIQLSGTEVLTRGIPVGSPQFAQIELAQAALKDYAYTWAKLGLMSEGEDFIMRLQFDGKPSNPLPFIYKKDMGGFVRVEVGSQGSVFQGIGLDVNLRLPLNQLLQYKDIVNKIE